jgi:lipoprotein-anchoring transpeptidase ErfK/SrfK
MRRLLPLAVLAVLAPVAGCGDRPVSKTHLEAPKVKFKVDPDDPVPGRPEGRWLVARVMKPTTLRTRPGGQIVAEVATETEFGSPRILAVVRRKGDWLEVIATEQPNGEHAWLPEADVKLYGTDVSIHVDISERSLEVREVDDVVDRMEVAVGRPDTPTPPGRYAVTDRLEPGGAGSYYGCCVIALSGHQPELLPGWIGGDRLAIHGTPSKSTVGDKASLGCLRGFDKDLERLMDTVPLGAPVFVRA